MQKESLENSVRTLKKMRDTYHGQLDICVLNEIDDVISQLENASCATGKAQIENVGLRALQVIAVLLSVISNIKDLIK